MRVHVDLFIVHGKMHQGTFFKRKQLFIIAGGGILPFGMRRVLSGKAVFQLQRVATGNPFSDKIKSTELVFFLL